MKKLLIGCGIVLLLAIGAIAYLAYQLKDDFQTVQNEWNAGHSHLQQLDAESSFSSGALDEHRFAQSLSVRLALSDYLREFQSNMQAAHEEARSKDVGWLSGFIESMSLMLRQVAPLLDGFAQRLDEAGMGPSEFSHHTRVLWATLRRIKDGVRPELASLQDAYPTLRELYESASKEEDIPPLDNVIGDFDLPVLEAAEAVLAIHLDQVQASLSQIRFEPFYMRLPEIVSTDEDVAAAAVATSLVIVLQPDSPPEK